MKSYKDDVPADGGFIELFANSSRKPRRGRRSRRPGALLLAGVLGLALSFAPLLAGWRTSAQSRSCDITQITFTTGEARLGPGLAINADGTRIAIESFHDLANNNADLNSEIFLFDTDTNSFTQITDSIGPAGNFTNTLPSINADGTRLAFYGAVDPTGDNADLNQEVFLYDTVGDSITQITRTLGGLGNELPAINADGTRLAFESDRDLTSHNADLNHEVFLYDRTQNRFDQITNTNGAFSGRVGIDDSGARLSFSSDADLTGNNADGGFEVFHLDMTNNRLTQITTNPTGGSSLARLSDDGMHLVLESFSDLTGDNPDGSLEVFLYDTRAARFTQVSNYENVSGQVAFPALNGDGSRVVFGSEVQLGANNADGNLEYFLAACDDGDSDDDGIPDDSDPDTVADVVTALPDTAFRSAGNKNAFLSRLEEIEQLILAGNLDQAVTELHNLRRRVDGCGAAADQNDWVTDCAAQLQVRALLDMLIANLSS